LGPAPAPGCDEPTSRCQTLKLKKKSVPVLPPGMIKKIENFFIFNNLT